METQVFTSTAHVDIPDMDAQELEAINEYDYEKAMLLYERQNQLRAMNVEEAKEHYEQQMLNRSEELVEILRQRLEENEARFKEDTENARKRLQQRIEDLAAAQNDDMQKLEARWRAAREYQKKQIDKTVETMLSSSQLLAKSRQFQEAIEMRDKARAIEARKKHPSLDQIDAEFKQQFQIMLVRHERAFKELIAQHRDLVRLFEEKLNTANRTAEAECDIGHASSTLKIMNTALADSLNQEAAVPVVQHFSPRSSACPSRTTSRMRNSVMSNQRHSSQSNSNSEENA